MKATVDIADALLQEARELARHERTTLKALIEEGLRSVLSRGSGSASFKLADASVDGEGLQPGLGLASWDEIREPAYGDCR